MELWELIEVRLAWQPQPEEEVAGLLGVSQPTFNRWRRSENLPAIEHYQPLSKWLDTDVATVARAVDRQRLRRAEERLAMRRRHSRR